MLASISGVNFIILMSSSFLADEFLVITYIIDMDEFAAYK